MEVTWLESLREALDRVEYGVVLLDDNLTVRFINKAFVNMWRFSDSMLCNPALTFQDLMAYGAAQGNWNIAPDDIPQYIEDRVARVKKGADGPFLIRLADKRTIKFESIPLPAGGRMLTYADQSQLINAIERLESIVNIDELTRLYNRRYMFTRGADEIRRALRYQRPLSVVMMDIDHFKQVNDRYGHAGGDQVLREVSKLCGSLIRANDILARIGGEEFVLLLPETKLAGAVMVAEKLRTSISRLTIELVTGIYKGSASFGVATFKPSCGEIGQLLSWADEALYHAKEKGRNQVALYSDEVAS